MNKYLIYISLIMVGMYSCQNEVDQFDPTIFNAPGDYNDALTLIQDLES